jgi:outer membrane protein
MMQSALADWGGAMLSALFAALVATSGPRVLTLDEAVKTGLQHQPQLRQAHAGTDAALARADEARAPLLPQVTAIASYQRATGNYVPKPGALPKQATATAMSSGSSFDTGNYFSTGVTLSQYLWDFGLTTDRWRSAQAAARSTAQSERASALQVVLGVRTAYFAARADRDLVQVARETLANQERHLGQIEGQVKVGARPEIDLAQARSDRATAEAQLISAENVYATAKAQLNLAMGMEGPADYEVDSAALPAVDGEDLPTAQLVDEAIRARPDLAALKEQLRASQLSVSSAKGAYWPSLNAATSLTDAGTDLGDLRWNWNATINLSWSLFSGLLTASQVREARANLSAVEAQRDGLRQQVYLDVEQARLGVRAAKASLHATDEALVNAKVRLNLAEGRYTAGVGNVIELGDAQVALTNAAAQRTQADFILAVARAQLLRALGRS